jgi:tetratricopeptide (TPR) repeat protein
VAKQKKPDSVPPGASKEKHGELRHLRDEASSAVLKGRYLEALGLCHRLEELQPDDPSWSRRAAYCCHRLGRRAEEQIALIRAAEGYERIGFLRKAMAMYRLALALDPGSNYLAQRIDELSAGRSTGLESMAPPAKLQYLTPSEIPPPINVEHQAGVDVLSAGSIPGSGPIRAREGFIRDTQKLIDEFQLIEFTDTEVEPK